MGLIQVIFFLENARQDSPRLAWQATFKKTKVKLDLLTDIDILLMVEKGMGCGICHVNSSICKN